MKANELNINDIIYDPRSGNYFRVDKIYSDGDIAYTEMELDGCNYFCETEHTGIITAHELSYMV